MLAKAFAWLDRPNHAFFTIFALSFVVRVSIIAFYGSTGFMAVGEAENLASSLVHSGDFANPFRFHTGASAHCTPFYPVVVAAIYFVFGDGVVGNLFRCLQTATAYSVLYASYPFVARALDLPFRAGVVGGLLSAAVPVRLTAETYRGWEEPYSALVLILLSVVFFRVLPLPVPPWRTAVIYGAAAGLAMYISPGLLPVVTAFGVVHLMRAATGQRGRIAAWWAVVMGAIFVVTLPWNLRDRAVLGHWVFMRSNLGLELAVANNDFSGPSVVQNNTNGAMEHYHPGRNFGELARMERLGEGAYYRSKMEDAIAWMRSHPARMSELTAERILYSWSGGFDRKPAFVLSSFFDLGGAWGMWLLWKRRHATFPVLAAIWLAYPLLYYFIQFLTRYRVPMDWAVMLPMGCAMVWTDD